MATSSLLSTLLILLIGVMLAKLSAGRLARWAIPAIVLELAIGFLIGNTVLPFSAVAPLSGLTELGVLTLFFQVGLEVRGDLLLCQRRPLSRLVAISFLAPLLAFWPLRSWFALSTATTLLCLAVLCATGTGVTLRVLAQRQALQIPSGRLLVAVSVLDDLPAIGLLAIATAMAGRSMGSSGLGPFAPLLGLAAAALSLALVDRWGHQGGQAPRGPLGILILLIASAWVGEVTGLTSLLGALWGGVLLARLAPLQQDVRSVLTVLSDVFLPLYFISVGMRIEVATLLRPASWWFALVLIGLALLSKLVCGFGIGARDRQAGIDRWLVVFGLLPRGLPGLVFATTALSAGLIDSLQFSALVLMVTVTTVVGLLLLERRLKRLEWIEPPQISTSSRG
jgi:Kef-type K+ transport system membrane component KefB